MAKKSYTPLRYPGGKAKLFPYLKSIIQDNRLYDFDYAEPYAGGAGVALELLMTEHVSNIHLNDLNKPLYAFWHSVTNDTDAFCAKLERCTLTINAWRRHKKRIANPEGCSLLDLGFSFFFLNRANRSGIINGGVIGGLDQSGNYKIDARFNKSELTSRIQKIAEYRHRIHLYNQDACDFLRNSMSVLPEKTLIYLDPPYYNKGQRLYDNYYSKSDHAQVSETIAKIDRKWLVSYDNVEQIRELYTDFRQVIYDLQYSAHVSKKGSEVMIFCDELCIPSLDNISAA